MQSDIEVAGRQHLRIAYEGATAAVRCSKSEPALIGSVLDISISGCRLSMPHVLNLISDQMIEVQLDLTHLAIRTMGFVRHVNRAENAVGIEFHKLSEKVKAELDEFINFFAPL